MRPTARSEAEVVLSCAAVLLDLDGTLVDSSDAILRGWHGWAAEADIPVTGLADIVHGRAAAETIAMLVPGIDDGDLRRHVRRVLERQEQDPAPAEPIAGAAEFVRALEEHPWGVVTGCSKAMAAARLAAVGLPVPGVLVTDEDVAAGKPHPDGYLLALRRLGITAELAVAVEDAPAGVLAAKAAGLRTVAVTSTHPPEALAVADFVVSSLAEISVSVAGGDLVLIADVIRGG